MKKIFLILSVILAVSASCSKSSNPTATKVTPASSNYNTPIQIGEQVLYVEVANTESEREQGLSDRESLAENNGMLFDFHNSGIANPQFWMKDMKFGLDFIWIKDNKVIGITPNVPAPPPGTPEMQLKIYSPPSGVDAVLEVTAGWAQKHNIKTGDQLRFLLAKKVS